MIQDIQVQIKDNPMTHTDIQVIHLQGKQSILNHHQILEDNHITPITLEDNHIIQEDNHITQEDNHIIQEDKQVQKIYKLKPMMPIELQILLVQIIMKDLEIIHH